MNVGVYTITNEYIPNHNIVADLCVVQLQRPHFDYWAAN